jgi:hypothetical protein
MGIATTRYVHYYDHNICLRQLLRTQHKDENSKMLHCHVSFILLVEMLISRRQINNLILGVLREILPESKPTSARRRSDRTGISLCFVRIHPHQRGQRCGEAEGTQSLDVTPLELLQIAPALPLHAGPATPALAMLLPLNATTFIVVVAVFQMPLGISGATHHGS